MADKKAAMVGAITKLVALSAGGLLLAAACATRPIATPAPAPSSLTPVRGTAGDTVRVIINHVLASKRDQFERFTHEILMPAMVKVAPSDSITAKQMRRARLLFPTAMDADSTWAYVFIVDPVATTASYSFPKLLTGVYGTDRAAEYMKMFRESLARPQDTYLVVNRDW